MNSALSEVFGHHGILLYGCIPFSACHVILERKLPQEFEPRSVIIFAIPYFPGERSNRNLSLYAVPRDYHCYFKEALPSLCADLRAAFPQGQFVGYTDNSPIDERHAAALAGLGRYGDNWLLITKEYGTFVFLAEFLSDRTPQQLGETGTLNAVEECLHCGKCKEACPMLHNPFGIKECLSALTQKKQPLTEQEIQYIKHYKSAWGCDLCQAACPYNRAILESGTPRALPFFLQQQIFRLTYADVAQMPQDIFADRAYAWRGRKTILRNLALLEEDAAGK